MGTTLRCMQIQATILIIGLLCPYSRGAVRHTTSTTTTPDIENSTSTSPATFLTTTSRLQTSAPRPINIEDAFEFIEDAAIIMEGASFYVNYVIMDDTLEAVLDECFERDECLSLDYNVGMSKGWLHRIPRRCADKAGASYVTGRRGVLYYEKLPKYRRIPEDEECNLPTGSSGTGSSGRGRSMVVVAATVGSLIAVLFLLKAALTLTDLYRQRQATRRRQELLRARAAQRQAQAQQQGRPPQARQAQAIRDGPEALVYRHLPPRQPPQIRAPAQEQAGGQDNGQDESRAAPNQAQQERDIRVPRQASPRLEPDIMQGHEQEQADIVEDQL